MAGVTSERILLWNEFATLPEVEAIALGGSRAGADHDEKSDSKRGLRRDGDREFFTLRFT